MIRVLVVDDHPVVRHGLMAILRWEKDIELVGDAADGLEAVRLILEQHPDVVLLDLRLPHLSGIEVMKQVRSQGLPTRFLVLTTYDTDEYIAPALAAGAQGYLLKDAEPEELSRAVRSLMRGGAGAGAEGRRAAPGSVCGRGCPRGAFRPGAGGAEVACGRRKQQVDRPATLALREHHQIPHQPHLRQTRRSEPRGGRVGRDATRFTPTRPAVASVRPPPLKRRAQQVEAG